MGSRIITAIKGLLAGVAILAVAMAGLGLLMDATAPSTAAGTSAAPDAHKPAAHKPAIKRVAHAPIKHHAARSRWVYQSDVDQMTGKATRYALVRSSNAFALQFPYAGAQHAELTLRQHPRHGHDSIISIERGQLQCDAFDGCKLMVRFDDAAPQRWTFVTSANHATTLLFLRDGRQFARKVARSKRVRVELQFFQSPPVVADFDVAGLDRKRVGI